MVNMLRARNAPRMPPDRPLPEDDIRLVERWILNGAKDPGFHLGVDAGSDAHHPADARADAPSRDGHTGSDAPPADAHAKVDGAQDGGKG